MGYDDIVGDVNWKQTLFSWAGAIPRVVLGLITLIFGVNTISNLTDQTAEVFALLCLMFIISKIRLSMPIVYDATDGRSGYIRYN